MHSLYSNKGYIWKDVPVMAVTATEYWTIVKHHYRPSLDHRTYISRHAIYVSSSESRDGPKEGRWVRSGCNETERLYADRCGLLETLCFAVDLYSPASLMIVHHSSGSFCMPSRQKDFGCSFSHLFTAPFAAESMLKTWSRSQSFSERNT